MCDMVGCQFYIEYEVKQLGNSLGLHETNIFYHILQKMTDLYYVQDTGGSLMSRLYIFRPPPLFYHNTKITLTSTLTWDTLLIIATKIFMMETT